MARRYRVRISALALANLLLPVAILVFASGFFPYKPVLPGLATFEEVGEDGGTPAAVFDRVVFMVVDALRSDFVYGHESGFGFTQSLVRSGAAIPFTAHATPPTVTMPRVKALTTGSVPSFLDLILNFAESDTSSSLAAQDTWLAQIRARGGNLIFYGDDTWLKLFPDPTFFARQDGTSSFFVSDFTEVDNNVTRHVAGEMLRSDWNAMIMHYLGLDHIGHKTGPLGPNMLPKQREMDGIVEIIYDAMETQAHLKDTLLVLAGDHGMNAGGNHGGSGPGETEPALLFASPKFKSMEKRREYDCPTTPSHGTEFHYYTKVEQSDLVPTLAGLMGLPVPRNSLGIYIPELAGFWGENDVLKLLSANAKQIRQIIDATYGAESFQAKIDGFGAKQVAMEEVCEQTNGDEQNLACLWAWADHAKDMKAQLRAVTAFLASAQDALSGTASSYNILRMAAGIVLAALVLAVTLLSFPTIWPPSTASTFFVLTCILYGVLMFASSYVEEEQQFWYWLTPAWIVLLTTSRLSKVKFQPKLLLAAGALLAAHRFTVRWNQTGQKNAGAPDIVHDFFPDAHVLMWLLILATYAYHGLSLIRITFAGLLAPEVATLLSVALVVPAVVFKLNFTQADAPELVQGLASQLRQWTEPLDLVLQARVVFLALAAVTIVAVTLSLLSARASRKSGIQEPILLPSLSERLHHLLTIFLMTQARTPNVPLFLGMELQRETLAYVLSSTLPSTSSSSSSQDSHEHQVTQIATTALLLSHAYFFAMGGSNSISSIDLSNAYNGVADYNIVAVGVLLFASNWAGPIWWCSAANLLLEGRPSTPGPSVRSAPSPSSSSSAASRSWVTAERQKLHEDALKTMMGPEKTTKTQDPCGSDNGPWVLYMSCMTAFVASGLVAVMLACTVLRTHLFIWTVFSPKYLYAMAWGVGWHLLINGGLGIVLRWGVDVV